MVKYDLDAIENILKTAEGITCASLVYRDGVGTLTTPHGTVRSDGTTDLRGEGAERIQRVLDDHSANDSGPSAPPRRRSAKPGRTGRS